MEDLTKEEMMKLMALSNDNFTLERLTKNFNNQIKKHMGVATVIPNNEHEICLKMIASYKVLKRSVTTEEIGHVKTVTEPVTVDTYELAELCANCNGHKEIAIKEFKERVCPVCDGTSLKRQKCKFCIDGKFKQENERLVDCRVCSGKGYYFNRKWNSVKNLCNTCLARGSVFDYVEGDRFRDCPTCKGEGKIKLDLFNTSIRQQLEKAPILSVENYDTQMKEVKSKKHLVVAK